MLQGEIWECLAGLWEISSFTASHVGCAATPVPVRGKSQHVGMCWNHTNAHQPTKINLKIARSAKMLSSYSLTAFLPIWFARRNLEGVLNSSPVSNVHQLQSHLNTGYTNDAYAFWNALAVSVAGLLSVGLGSITGAKLGFLNKQKGLARDATGRCASRWIFETLRCHMVLLASHNPPSRNFALPSKPVAGRAWSRLDVRAPCYVGLIGSLASLPLIFLMVFTECLGGHVWTGLDQAAIPCVKTE